MQLNEILEENTIKAMSQKTKVSEENIENLLMGKFDSLKRIQALGFISIVEREYKADLNSLRKQASDYYDQHAEHESITLSSSSIPEKKGKSKLFLFLVLVLLGYATWYFFTQFDEKHLSGLLPFSEEQFNKNILPSIEKADISIEEGEDNASFTGEDR